VTVSFFRTASFDISGEELPEELDAPGIEMPSAPAPSAPPAPGSKPRLQRLALVATLVAGVGMGVLAMRLGTPQGDDDPVATAQAGRADQDSSAALVERAATGATRTSRPQRADRSPKRHPRAHPAPNRRPPKRRPRAPSQPAPPASAAPVQPAPVEQAPVQTASAAPAPASPPPPPVPSPAPPAPASTEFGLEP
jgi:hypothetical protein